MSIGLLALREMKGRDVVLGIVVRMDSRFFLWRRARRKSSWERNGREGLLGATKFMINGRLGRNFCR